MGQPYNPRMHLTVESKRDAVADLCRRLGVKRLEVFGSAAREDFAVARSDIDFLVEFDEAADDTPLKSFFGLKDALEQLFGRSVDLLMPAAVHNPYIQASIDRSRQLVYGA